MTTSITWSTSITSERSADPSVEVSHMAYRIALNFEDGITRFIECQPGRPSPTRPIASASTSRSTAATAPAARARASASRASTTTAATSKTRMTEDEAAEGYVLACQMKPQARTASFGSRPPPTSARPACPPTRARSAAIDHLSATTTSFSLKLEAEPPLTFLPGQYVNIAIPDTGRAEALVLVQLVAACARGLAS